MSMDVDVKTFFFITLFNFKSQIETNISQWGGRGMLSVVVLNGQLL